MNIFNNNLLFHGDLRLFLNKNKAFTLAEVLIVLAIVGIIAAITIPSLINIYNRKMLEVRFKKTDAVLTQAMRMASNELGIESFAVYNKVTKDELETTKANLYNIWEKQFRGATKIYVKNDLNNPKSFLRRFTYRFLTGNTFTNWYYTLNSTYNNDNDFYVLLLPDGSMVSAPWLGSTMEPDTASNIIFVFDTNGPWAGPNRLGYDVFYYFGFEYANPCQPLSTNSYSDRGCYKYAHINQNPYDKSITWWSSLYKDKSWWENLKNNSSK